MIRESADPVVRPRISLRGNPAARPPDLEPALIRGGFQLVEREDPSAEPEADAILITLKDINEASLSHLLARPGGKLDEVPPRIVLIAVPDREAAAAALSLGAEDAMAAPIHLPELCARLHARINGKLEPARGTLWQRLREVGEALTQPVSDPDDATSTLPALDCRLKEEFERARRYSLSFSLILLGVDELRGVRERQGSEVAARMTREVAEVLRRELRLPDFVIGCGDSEFAIVLPETGPTGARQSVLRVRERLALVPSDGDPRLEHPRFSAGIVTYPHPAVSQSDELYAMAEAALMRGKAQSGERIGVAM